MSTAAILVIGNEVLSGKIRDANVEYLARELFMLGITLECVRIVRDDVQTIAREVRELSGANTWLFTTGGVGPTHDDVTIEGVAAAFGRKVVQPVKLADMLRAYYKERITPEHLRMANIPEGAELIENADLPWPTPKVENTFIFPGIPDLVRMKFPIVRDLLNTLEKRDPFFSVALYLNLDESDISDWLRALASRYPDVSIGSYPKWRGTDYKTKLTFDGRSQERIREAARELELRYPADLVNIESAR